jgi:hypothetical protein
LPGALQVLFHVTVFRQRDRFPLHAAGKLHPHTRQAGRGGVCSAHIHAKRLAVPEAMHDLPMLKLLLQPIVENAIGQGIRERDGAGHIQISGGLTDDMMWFEIADDSIDMEASKLTELNKALQFASRSQSIGLFNVN